MDLQLNGKVALVTGGARDVGREISLALAAEGVRVAVNYRNSAQDAEAVVAQIRQAGGTAKAYKADVADLAEVQAMVAAVASDF
ncbi:MAG: 3-oxoacyl-ACP reductase, partial [Rhizobiales bacterium 32-66-8]